MLVITVGTTVVGTARSLRQVSKILDQIAPGVIPVVRELHVMPWERIAQKLPPRGQPRVPVFDIDIGVY